MHVYFFFLHNARKSWRIIAHLEFDKSIVFSYIEGQQIGLIGSRTVKFLVIIQLLNPINHHAPDCYFLYDFQFLGIFQGMGFSYKRALLKDFTDCVLKHCIFMYLEWLYIIRLRKISLMFAFINVFIQRMLLLNYDAQVYSLVYFRGSLLVDAVLVFAEFFSLVTMNNSHFRG